MLFPGRSLKRFFALRGGGHERGWPKIETHCFRESVAQVIDMLEMGASVKPIVLGNRLPKSLLRAPDHPSVILGYHKIGPRPSAGVNRSNYVDAVQLHGQVQQISGAGWQAATLDSVADPAPGGGRLFAVTFDDGYASVCEQGLPVLSEYGIKALVYLVAGQIGGSNFWDQAAGDISQPLMCASQVRAWLSEGHSIGSHTLSHAALTQIPEGEARRELVESKERLEQRFSVPVNHFCFPYGDHNAVVCDLVREAGYASAVTVEQRPISPNDSRLALPRWMVYTHPVPWLANLRARWGI